MNIESDQWQYSLEGHLKDQIRHKKKTSRNAGLFFTAIGIILIVPILLNYFEVIYLKEKLIELTLWGAGGLTCVLGAFFLVRITWIGKSPEQKFVLNHLDELVWYYWIDDKLQTKGIHSSDPQGLCLANIQGKKYIIPIPQGKMNILQSYLQKKYPNLLFGYDFMLDQEFKQNPESLLNIYSEDELNSNFTEQELEE